MITCLPESTTVEYVRAGQCIGERRPRFCVLKHGMEMEKRPRAQTGAQRRGMGDADECGTNREVEAGNGLAALAQLEAGAEPALIVLDLDMPGMGGREVLGRVRQTVATAGLPVLVLTGSGTEDMEALLMEEGADDYIRKPLEPARFVARLSPRWRS